MLFAQLRYATNAAASAELCYISLASPALSLGRQAHIFPACTSMWPLKKPRFGHGLSNRTGSAGPDAVNVAKCTHDCMPIIDKLLLDYTCE